MSLPKDLSIQETFSPTNPKYYKSTLYGYSLWKDPVLHLQPLCSFPILRLFSLLVFLYGLRYDKRMFSTISFKTMKEIQLWLFHNQTVSQWPRVEGVKSLLSDFVVYQRNVSFWYCSKGKKREVMVSDLITLRRGEGLCFVSYKVTCLPVFWNFIFLGNALIKIYCHCN